MKHPLKGPCGSSKRTAPAMMISKAYITIGYLILTLLYRCRFQNLHFVELFLKTFANFDQNIKFIGLYYLHSTGVPKVFLTEQVFRAIAGTIFRNIGGIYLTRGHSGG